MRFAAGLLVTLTCVTSASAYFYEPWTNLVLEAPGLTDELFLDTDSACPSIRCDWSDGNNRGADGSTYFVRNYDPVPNATCESGGFYRSSIWRTRADGTTERVAYIDDVCACSRPYNVSLQISVDATNGVMYVRRHLENHCTGDPDGADVIRIRGFLTLFDVVQTYTPPSTLGFQVPYMPEGMGGADHFDTYWGTLTNPIDFTQAHPLMCGYPAAQPHVGDYFTIADTVPTPAPGQGVYYVTATTYQGQTRYGRKAMNGHLTGRDPALLPACVAP